MSLGVLVSPLLRAGRINWMIINAIKKYYEDFSQHAFFVFTGNKLPKISFKF